MIRDHAEIEELLAIRSLGGLDDDDAGRLETQLASHGDCAECRRLADGYDETAGRLGFSLEPMSVDLGQADEILRRATHPATQEVAPTPPAIRIDELRERRSRPGRTWPAIAAAAAALLLVISAVAIFGPQRSTGVTVSSDQTVVGFSGGAGELAMAYQAGKPGALLVGSGFAGTIAGTAVVVVGSVVSTTGAVVDVVEDDVVACGDVVVVAPGAVVVVGAAPVTTTKPTMLGCSSQW